MDQFSNISVDHMKENASEAASLLKSMSNVSRLLILCHLVDGEKSVSQLLESMPISQSALSQHLAVLRREELVTTTRVAQSIYYSLASVEVRGVLETLYRLYCAPSDL